MVIKIIDESFDNDSFNQLATHPLQSWQWGEARKEMGIEVVRIGEITVRNGRDRSLQDVYQMTLHKIPHTKFKIGYLPRSKFPTNDILAFLSTFAKNNNIIFIKIEPDEVKNNFKSQISNFKLSKSPHPLFPSWTQILDLTKSEDKLFKNLKSKTRYNIRLAQKKGIIVKEEKNDKGFETFIKLYFETCKRQKYRGHDYNYHKILWNNLKNDISHILIAYYNNIPLAAYELFYFNKTFYYPYGGTSPQHRNLMASNLLMWEAIKMGKKLGATKFDMWGSLEPIYKENHPWAGFTKFKEGYNTQFVEMIGSYDLIVFPNLYKLYNLADSVRSYLLGQRS